MHHVDGVVCICLTLYCLGDFIMSAKNKLEALKAAFDKKAGSSTNDQTWKLFYPFWKIPEEAVAVVRFLPDLDEDNPLGFLVENLQHELIINGQRKTVGCLSMHDEPCPICELSRKYYDEENPELGKKYYRKKSYIGQVIVVDSPIEHDQAQLVKLIEFGPQVFTQIQAAFRSGDLDESPDSFKGGYNFRFRKTKTGSGQNSYSTSSFSPKQSDLTDDVIEQLSLYNLADYRGKKLDRSVIEAMLVAEQTGSAFGSQEEEEAPAPAEKPAAKSVAKPVATAAKAEQVEEAEAEAPAATASTSSKSSVLEQLRARAKAAKASA
jgi:hypothetical protein